MNKNILTTLGLTAFFAVGIVSLNVITDSGTTSVYAFSSSTPGAKTGSPGDAANCTQCHSGSVLTTNASSITTNIPAAGYVSGQTYTITGTITDAAANKFGFEITAEKDLDDSKIGTMIITDATNTQTNGTGAPSVTHKSAGTTGAGSRIWSFDWTAPASGTGDVTFYGAFNAANNDGSTAGDKIYTTSIGVSEDVQTSLVENSNKNGVSIFPNPIITSFEVITSKKIDAVKIYTLAGKEVKSVIQNENVFDAASLTSGIYFVQITSEGETTTKKFIKK